MCVSVFTRFSAIVMMGTVVAPGASGHPGSGIVVDEKGQVFFTDTGNPGPAATSAAGTINITVNGPVIWFVQTTGANPVAAGTGRRGDPRTERNDEARMTNVEGMTKTLPQPTPRYFLGFVIRA